MAKKTKKIEKSKKCPCCEKNPCEACKGKGFELFAVNGDEKDLQIQKCDCCGKFKSDSDASEYVYKLAVKQLRHVKIEALMN